LSSNERIHREEVVGEEEEENWGELLARIDASRFSMLFRNLVLLAGLLRLRESSAVVLYDLRVIMRETEKYLKRISSARGLHPEVRILETIQGNLVDFSSQSQDFQKALTSSELRIELELLSLSLQLSKSVSPEIKEKKARFARKLTKLAQHMRSQEEESKIRDLPTKTSQFPRDDGVGKSKDRE